MHWQHRPQSGAFVRWKVRQSLPWFLFYREKILFFRGEGRSARFWLLSVHQRSCWFWFQMLKLLRLSLALRHHSSIATSPTIQRCWRGLCGLAEGFGASGWGAEKGLCFEEMKSRRAATDREVEAMMRYVPVSLSPRDCDTHCIIFSVRQGELA